MKNKKRSIISRKLIIILFFILSFLILFLINFNFLLTPKSSMYSESRVIVFRWIGFSKSILIDKSKDFNSPLELTGEGIAIAELDPGVYFWKTKSGISPTKKFEIVPFISVEKKEIENRTIIKNKGNVNILLEAFNNFGLIGYAVLELNEEINLTNTTEVIISQNG